jgi:hypothetical protein
MVEYLSASSVACGAVWRGSGRRDSPHTRLVSPPADPHLRRLALSGDTLHHVIRWNVKNRDSQLVPRPRCGPPSARTASRAPASDRRRGLAPSCVTAGLVPPSSAEAPWHIPAFPVWPGGGQGGSETERCTRFVCRRERLPSVLPRPTSHLVHGASRAGLFVSTGTGATHLSDRRVLGQRLERGKPPRDRAPRAPQDRGQSPTAAPAPPQSAAGLLRTRFHKNPGRALRPRHPMVSSIHPPSLVSRNMIPSSNRSTRDLSHKKHERMRH